MLPFEIRITVTEDDLLAFRRDRREPVAVWATPVIVFILLWGIPGNARVILMALAAVFLLCRERARRRSSRTALKLWADAGECTCTVDDTSVIFSSAQGWRRYEWSTIMGLHELPSSITLTHVSGAQVFIPRRCLDAQQLAAIRDLFRQTRHAMHARHPEQQRPDWTVVAVAAALFVIVYIIVFGDDLVAVLGEDITWWFLTRLGL